MALDYFLSLAFALNYLDLVVKFILGCPCFARFLSSGTLLSSSMFSGNDSFPILILFQSVTTYTLHVVSIIQ